METSVVKRFLRYIAVDTQSAAEKDVIPSTAKQFDLAKILVEELKEMGAQDPSVRSDRPYGYFTSLLGQECESAVHQQLRWKRHSHEQRDWSYHEGRGLSRAVKL